MSLSLGEELLSGEGMTISGSQQKWWQQSSLTKKQTKHLESFRSSQNLLSMRFESEFLPLTLETRL